MPLFINLTIFNSFYEIETNKKINYIFYLTALAKAIKPLRPIIMYKIVSTVIPAQLVIKAETAFHPRATRPQLIAPIAARIKAVFSSFPILSPNLINYNKILSYINVAFLFSRKFMKDSFINNDLFLIL